MNGKYASYRSNAHYNREMAVKCLKEGMTPEQIAKEWPHIWVLTKDKKIKQSSQDTDYFMVKVRETIAKYRKKRVSKVKK